MCRRCDTGNFVRIHRLAELKKLNRGRKWAQTAHSANRDVRVCAYHLDDHGKVLPLKSDPVVCGTIPGRNAIGDTHVSSWSVQNERTPLRKKTQRGTVTIAEYERTLKLLKSAQTELKTFKKSSAAHKSPKTRKAIPIGSWAWLTSSDDIANTMAGATITELEVMMDVMRTGGGPEAFAERFTNKPKIEFNDAVALVLWRLFAERRYWKLEVYSGIDRRVLNTYFKPTAHIIAAIADLTLLRPPDKGYLEKHVTTMMGPGSDYGPGGKYGPVWMIIDGMKVEIQYSSDSSLHQIIHSAYIKQACAQCTLGLGCDNNYISSTGFYAGSYGESTICIDDTKALFSGLPSGSKVGMDKGYHLRNHLRETYGAEVIAPTEMTKVGMSESNGWKSREFARVRAAIERLVWHFKRWDIFGGTPIHMSELPMLDDYKSIVALMIRLKGPLPDHLRMHT